MTKDKSAQSLVEPTFGEKLETWYDRNSNWLNIALIVVLAGIIGYKAYEWMHARNIAQANVEYGMALNRYQMAFQAQEDSVRNNELQGAITAAQQVVAEHRDAKVGRLAQLMIGNAQYVIATSETGRDVKMLEEARESYRTYLDMATDNSEKATGYIALGNVLENLSFIQSDQKVHEEAVDAYTQALSASEGTALGAEAKLALARAKTARNASEGKAAAAKMYQEVLENRDVQLVSDAELEDIKPIVLESGGALSAEEIKDIKNLAGWSQKRIAEDALARLK